MSSSAHPPAVSDAILQAALDPVITCDADGRIVDLNRAAETVFGHPRSEALGCEVAVLLVPPRMRAAHRDGLARVIAGGPSRIVGRRTRLIAMRADGTEFPVEMSLTRTQQAPPLLTAWLRDLSERSAAEIQSARRKTLLERAEQIAQIGSWEWKPTTGEALWSDNLFRIFGFEPGSFTPSLRVVLDRTHPEDRESAERQLAAAARDGRLAPLEIRLVRPDGAVRYLRATADADGHDGDRALRLVGSAQDVTDQRRAERELAAHVAVSDALSGWRSFEQGADRLLRELVVALGFSSATLWCLDGDALNPRADWGELLVDARGRPIRGADLAGEAFARREPVGRRWPDRTVGPSRRTAVAFPALVGDEVLAVIELQAGDDIELSERLVCSLAGIGYQLGAFLAGRRGQLKPSPLTPREREILQLAAQGLAGPAIAERLVISPSTVKTHFENVYAKLDVRDRGSAVAHALREGLIE
jgi:PAS domain S-box-containing protein